MPDIELCNPDTLGAPLGQYSQMARVRAAELVFLAGQLSVDKAGEIIGAGDFDRQCTQVFANIGAALRSLGAGWKNIAQFTTYLVHSQDVLRFLAYRQRTFPDLFPGGAYPPNTLLMVDRLVQEPFLVEVQAIIAL